MLSKLPYPLASGLLIVTAICCWDRPADAQTNNWTSTTSGRWEDGTNWSLAVRPASGQTVVITNYGWKAVAIRPDTAQNFPDSLDVSRVILGGYTDSFNVLLLNYSGYSVPLRAGSVRVGTNSAIMALASVLTVSSDSGPGDLSIFSTFKQGEQATVNAHLINLGDFDSPADGPGDYYQTNGIVNADEVSLAGGSTFHQFYGANVVSKIWIGAANTNGSHTRYTMAGGYLTAGSIEVIDGDFNQTGGSVDTSLSLGAANYNLAGGTLHLPGITVPDVHYGSRNPGFMRADATLLQTGGTNFCNGAMTVYHEYGFPGVPVAFFGPGHYVLSNGVLFVSNTVSAYMSEFQQWGGWHTNGGTEVAGDIYPNWEIRKGSFTLGGGTLVTPWISISLGDFIQSGGTNQVSGNVGLGPSPATFELHDGLLASLDTSVDASTPASPGPQHAIFTQNGGIHIVTNVLRLTGRLPAYSSSGSLAKYSLSGGTLIAPDIQADSLAVFDHRGGTLTTSGLLTLGYASWNENTTEQQFGQLLLSGPAGTNATFSLPTNQSCVVRFTDSSSVTWSNQAGLLILNWNGSLSGAGAHQVFFGSSSSGLTPQQLGQVWFINPGGVTGSLPARILSTGEIVPGSSTNPMLSSYRSGNSLVLEWSGGSVLQTATNVIGPYQDLTSASSPYTVPMDEPCRFFRVQ